MNHKINIFNYAEELVAHYAKYRYDQYELSLSDLPESSLNELARLYIEHTNREVNECINGDDFSINNDFTCALLAMLQDDSQENRERFAEVTRKNILTYYKESLQKVLDEACQFYLNNMMNEQGLYARYDLENGDLIWSR
ncbi:hypothetical protein [Legionella micdadei]|nr:hypothetical protein [Legionella micdadei]